MWSRFSSGSQWEYFGELEMPAQLEEDIAAAIVAAHRRRVDQHTITQMLYEFRLEQDAKEEREILGMGEPEEQEAA